MGLTFAVAAALPAYAGTWRQDASGWWYQNDDGTYPAGGWQWIDGNGDGTAECYYFYSDGYMAYNNDIDGYHVNDAGQWTVGDRVQKKTVAGTASSAATGTASAGAASAGASGAASSGLRGSGAFPDHHRGNCRQKQGGHPDRSDPHDPRQHAAGAGADRKKQDDAEEMKRFIQGRLIFSPQVVRQALRAAPQVPDAHRACISVSVHLSEGLNLHGAGKGNQHICDHAAGRIVRQKPNQSKQQDLNGKDNLSPVDPAVFTSVFDPLRDKDTRGKGNQREHIVKAAAPVSHHKILAHQDHVAGLRIGKHMAPDVVCVRILQSP